MLPNIWQLTLTDMMSKNVESLAEVQCGFVLSFASSERSAETQADAVKGQSYSHFLDRVMF